MSSNLRDFMVARAELDRMFTEATRGEAMRLIGELRERREAAGLTQQQVADLIGISRTQITNAEGSNMRFGLSMEALIAYAVAVGARVELADLGAEDESMG